MSKLWFFVVIFCLQIVIVIVFQNQLSKYLFSNSESIQFCDSSSNISISEIILHEPSYNPLQADFVVLIHSAIENIKNRNVFRKQMKHFSKFNIVFVLGSGNIENESQFHDDILQGYFVDSYRNLTRKHVFGLSWAVNRFPDTKWILKIDDDIFVNFQMIEKHFERLKEKQALKKHYILGYVHDKMAVIRQSKSKWFVEKDEYSYDFYPEFVSGWGYLTRISSAKILLNIIKNDDKMFWIDDVYLTGIVRTKTCIRLFALNHLFNVDITRLKQWLNGEKLIFSVFFSNTNNDLAMLEDAFQRINNQKL